MAKPKSIFVASSSTAIPLAKALTEQLKKSIDGAKFTEWYASTPGKFILTKLITAKRDSDFAVVLLTKDDYGKKKGAK